LGVWLGFGFDLGLARLALALLLLAPPSLLLLPPLLRLLLPQLDDKDRVPPPARPHAKVRLDDAARHLVRVTVRVRGRGRVGVRVEVRGRVSVRLRVRGRVRVRAGVRVSVGATFFCSKSSSFALRTGAIAAGSASLSSSRNAAQPCG